MDRNSVPSIKERAEQGHVNAQANLGLMYGKGEGLTQNYIEAFKWFSIVISGGKMEDFNSKINQQ